MYTRWQIRISAFISCYFYLDLLNNLEHITKTLISSKNQKARLQFAKKYRDEPQTFWNTVLWTDETQD